MRGSTAWRLYCAVAHGTKAPKGAARRETVESRAEEKEEGAEGAEKEGPFRASGPD